MLIMLQRVLPVLLLCADVLFQQAQNLTGLVVAQGYVISGMLNTLDTLLKHVRLADKQPQKTH